MSAGKSAYRRDIDGLRAVAVLSVLTFHAFPTIIPGGFVGVDIFFVISGYLISGIILNELNNGSFTFSGFYVRRIRRIFPALALVLALSLIAGWWMLLPFDYRQLGGHVTAGAGFVSNILLWREAGDYFDTAAELKPLLHLWSLGVEEQYYLIWPLLLFLIRGRTMAILWMITAIAAASFALNLFTTTRMPMAAFYLPIGRFWELMLGSFVAYIQLHHPGAIRRLLVTNEDTHESRASVLANLIALIGIFLIVTAFAIINELRPFPGWWALLPTLGTVLLVSAGANAWVNRYILSNRSLVSLGLISYPLYLWHWPLLAYARVWNGGELSVVTRVALLAVAMVLASLTYHFVEKRIRHARPISFPNGPVLALATAIAALGVYGLLAAGNYSGARSASVPYLAKISEAVHDWEYRGDKVIRGDTADTVMFFGDSHMQQYLPRIEKLMLDRMAPVNTVVFRTKGGCAPVPDIERRGYGCRAFVDDGFSMALQPEVKTVVIGASWPGFTSRKDYFPQGATSGLPLDLFAKDIDSVLHGLETALHHLVAGNKRVVMVLSSPRGDEFDPTRMFERKGSEFRVRISPPASRDSVSAENAYIDNRIRQIAINVGAEIVDPLEALCPGSICPTTDTDGTPLYKDATHVRSTVARDRFTAFDRYVYVNGR